MKGLQFEFVVRGDGLLLSSLAGAATLGCAHSHDS